MRDTTLEVLTLISGSLIVVMMVMMVGSVFLYTSAGVRSARARQEPGRRRDVFPDATDFPPRTGDPPRFEAFTAVSAKTPPGAGRLALSDQDWGAYHLPRSDDSRRSTSGAAEVDTSSSPSYSTLA